MRGCRTLLVQVLRQYKYGDVLSSYPDACGKEVFQETVSTFEALQTPMFYILPISAWLTNRTPKTQAKNTKPKTVVWPMTMYGFRL